MVTMLALFSYFMRRALFVKRLNRTVLWLRRFHQDGIFPFDLVLDDVCRGVALPITVADTTVPKSTIPSQLSPVFSLGFLLIGLAFMGGFGAMAFFQLKQIAWVSIPLALIYRIISLFPGLRTQFAWFLSRKYEKELLSSISTAFEKRDMTRKCSAGCLCNKWTICKHFYSSSIFLNTL